MNRTQSGLRPERSQRQPKQMSTLLEVTVEEDSGDEEAISRACIYCKPELFLPRQALEEDDNESGSDDEQVEELRSHCKQRLRESGLTKREKAVFDEDLRQSYRHGNHQFNGLSKTKRHNLKKQKANLHVRLKKKIRKQPDNYKLCQKCSKKLTKSDAPGFKFDFEKAVYDESEIDYINEQQSRVFVSHVQTNPFLTHGVRAHCKELTTAHCLHSTLDARHRDFLPIWLHLVPLLCIFWEVFAASIHQEDTYHLGSGGNKVFMGVGLGLAALWLLARVVYVVFYSRGYAVEAALDKACAVSTALFLFGYSILFTQILIVPRYAEAGWIISYVMGVMLAANVVLSLNPIGKADGPDVQRGCCSNNYITLTISVLVCMFLLEANNVVATPE
jgi:hypothetical protein